MQDPRIVLRRSRRNLMKMGSVAAASAILAVARLTPADAGPPSGAPQPPGFFPRRGLHCFLEGTAIRTRSGDRKVEDLVVGEWLPTVFGKMRPIRWIGRSSFAKHDPARPWSRDVLPVRIARSALGPDVPESDLYISRTHALLIDGVLVPACSLVNGTTITIYDARERDRLEFFHLKLERHDVLFAAGAPCETLFGTDENAINFAEYLGQYGLSAIEDARCAPLLDVVDGGPREIRSRFRSALSPWIDRRQKIDIIRDELEEHGAALLRQSEPVLPAQP